MDSGQRGLSIRDNSIVMSFTYQGKRCRESFPLPLTKSALKQLQQKRQAILYEIKNGTFDYAKHFPGSRSKNALAFRKTQASQYTIAEAFNDWLKRNQAKYERSTLRDYHSSIYHHLIPQFGKLALSELSVIRIKDWLASLKCSNKRKNNILIPLRRLYDELYGDEIIEKNPLNRIKNLSVSSREPEPFTLSEIERILEQLNGQEKNIIQFAFWSGLRTSELIALGWVDVDFVHNRIYVRHAKVRGILKAPKTCAGSRTIILQPKAREALLNQRTYTGQLNETVFHDSRTNQPWKNDQPLRRILWTPALKRAGIKYREPYQTRHTFASILLSRGEEPMWVATQMGHKDWGMIRKVYGRWIPS